MPSYKPNILFIVADDIGWINNRAFIGVIDHAYLGFSGYLAVNS